MKRISHIPHVMVMGALGLAALTGCRGVVEREVTLVYQGSFPHASTTVVGDMLRLEVEHVVPPDAGNVYGLWARGELGWTRIGEVSPEAPSTFDVTDIADSWDQFDELVIGFDPVASPSDAPARGVLFRGPLSAPMSFAGIEPPADELLEPISLRARAENDELTVDATLLPEFDDAATWGLWFVLDEDDLESALRLGSVEAGTEQQFETNGIAAAGDALAIVAEIDGAETHFTHETITFLGPMLPEEDGEAPAPPTGHGEHTH